VKIRDLESPFVELRDVRKSFGPTAVLNGVDLAVGRSEVACIIGPSGSGKSTVLRCINALTRIDSGSVRVGDTRVDDPRVDTQALHRRVGIVFQGYNLFPHRTVLQNVMMAPIQVLRRERGEVEAQARALLAKVHLAGKENAYPGELSGGQQQRVAIARSLCMQPEVMLFDEVTAALDPETVKEVLGVIQEIAADGMTCLLVTHEMRFAREAADYLYFMDQGRVVEHGVAKEVFDAPADARTRAFLDKVL
jgi:polar amino acid transport system ATP-binding protein